MSKLIIGEILRYSRPYSPEKEQVGGLRNYFHATSGSGFPMALLEKGINPLGRVKIGSQNRTPAILISNSPHREGSKAAPWRDFFDVDNGHIRYFGDAKVPGQDPALCSGNKALLAARDSHHSFDAGTRASAPPILFFRRTSFEGARKGHLTFQGFGIVERAELISQFNRKTNGTFSNYVYDLAVLSMSREGELFDWDWINKLRAAELSLQDAMAGAPWSWKQFIKGGTAALPRLRRRVAKLRVAKAEEQQPQSGTPEHRTLRQIYDFYKARHHRFEGLAYEISKSVLLGSGKHIVDGWITPMGSDGGCDFVARLDIGEGFGQVRQIVYGQAKCVSPGSGTDGRDIARTVARLKRGWFGVFVTTGHVSEKAQVEIIEDEYPVLLITGSMVSQHTTLLAEKAGLSVSDYLKSVDAQFTTANRRPEEILHF